MRSSRRAAAHFVSFVGFAAAFAFAVACDAPAAEGRASAEPPPVVAAASPAADPGAPATSPAITVYKSPTCGCCTAWVDHLRAHGFVVAAHDTSAMPAIKRELGVPDALGSCHTAVVDGYVVEGHVPAAVIHKMLRERPAILGIAVPGMPMGSPGMEGPHRDAYDVMAFDRAGEARVYTSH